LNEPGEHGELPLRVSLTQIPSYVFLKWITQSIFLALMARDSETC